MASLVMGAACGESGLKLRVNVARSSRGMVSSWLPEVSPAPEVPEPPVQADRSRAAAAVAVTALRTARGRREGMREGAIIETLFLSSTHRAKTGWDSSAD